MDKNIVYILVVALLIAGGIIYVQSTHTPTPANTAASILTPSPTPEINLNPSGQINQNQTQPTGPTGQVAGAQTQVTPTPRQVTAQEVLQNVQGIATIKTSKGDIVLQLDKQDAPNTTANFVLKASQGFYNGLTFHRVEDWVIQGGDPKGDGTGGNTNFPVEFSNQPFKAGALGQASLGDGKLQNDSQFFIVKTDADWLDGKYTYYGQVTQGMDVVNKIAIGDKIESITIQ